MQVLHEIFFCMPRLTSVVIMQIYVVMSESFQVVQVYNNIKYT